jgi:hypothetical protein
MQSRRFTPIRILSRLIRFDSRSLYFEGPASRRSPGIHSSIAANRNMDFCLIEDLNGTMVAKGIFGRTLRGQL